MRRIGSIMLASISISPPHPSLPSLIIPHPFNKYFMPAQCHLKWEYPGMGWDGPTELQLIFSPNPLHRYPHAQPHPTSITTTPNTYI